VAFGAVQVEPHPPGSRFGKLDDRRCGSPRRTNPSQGQLDAGRTGSADLDRSGEAQIARRHCLLGFLQELRAEFGLLFEPGTQTQLMQWVNVDHEQPELEVGDLRQDELDFC
jgi:hypothetical protein